MRAHLTYVSVENSRLVGILLAVVAGHSFKIESLAEKTLYTVNIACILVVYSWHCKLI